MTQGLAGAGQSADCCADEKGSVRYTTPPRPTPSCPRPRADAPTRTDTAPQRPRQNARSHHASPIDAAERPEDPSSSQYAPSQAEHRLHRSVLRASTAAAGDVITTLDLSELVSQAARGDPAAWEEIIRRYSGLVAAKIRTFRLQDADTLDAMQITWLRLAENIHRIQHPEHLGGWLATTAARVCIYILHHANRTQSLTDAMVNTLADTTMNPEQRVIEARTAQILHTLVAELPPRRRRLLRALFTDQPPSYAELSSTTGMPLGSIGPARNRALRQLRRMLHDHQLCSHAEP